MRYFIEIVTPSQTIADPEGAEFVDLAAAEEEAAHAIRELIAEELRAGRPFPHEWMVCVRAGDGSSENVLPFRWFLTTNRAAGLSPKVVAQLREYETLLPQVLRTAAAAQTQNLAIRAHLEELRRNVRALASYKFGS